MQTKSHLESNVDVLCGTFLSAAVDLEVVAQRRLEAEPLPAAGDGAGEGPLARVGADVPRQVGRLLERLRAVLARVFAATAGARARCGHPWLQRWLWK